MQRIILIPESKIHIQEKTQWCYAAVIQMILEHYGTTINQAAIVKEITGSAIDNNPQNPIDYLMYRLHYIHEQGGCSGSKEIKFSQIKTEIDRGRPIIVKLSGGSGHYVLIVGYDAERLQIIIIDPNKSEYTLETFDVSGIKKVNTIFEDHVTHEDHTGPSNIGGFCFTHPPGEHSPKGSAAKGSSSAKGSPDSPKDSSSAKGAPGSPKGVKCRRGGMKSKKYSKSSKSRSTRKKIRGKIRRVRK